MLNPNKYIRQAVVSKLATIGITAYYKRIPKNTTPTNPYAIIHSQTRQRYTVGKGHYEWLCQINIDCYLLSTQGMPPNTTMDDIEQQILNAMTALDIQGGFIDKQIRSLQTTDLDIETQTQSIERRVMPYEIWVNNVY